MSRQITNQQSGALVIKQRNADGTFQATASDGSEVQVTNGFGRYLGEGMEVIDVGNGFVI
jgi:hypothetical protein